MWELLGREPKEVYHFTRRDCVDSIKSDRQLKKFKDQYTFVCESYDDCIKVIKNTFLNPKAGYLDFDGRVKPYSSKNVNDYVIIKVKPRYSKTASWYLSRSANDEKIDGVTLAYKGNLPITFLEEFEIIIEK